MKDDSAKKIIDVDEVHNYHPQSTTQQQQQEESLSESNNSLQELEISRLSNLLNQVPSSSRDNAQQEAAQTTTAAHAAAALEENNTTINDDNSNNNNDDDDKNNNSSNNSSKMAPKPHMYESSKGMDSEHNLIAAESSLEASADDKYASEASVSRPVIIETTKAFDTDESKIHPNGDSDDDDDEEYFDVSSSIRISSATTCERGMEPGEAARLRAESILTSISERGIGNESDDVAFTAKSLAAAIIPTSLSERGIGRRPRLAAAAAADGQKKNKEPTRKNVTFTTRSTTIPVTSPKTTNKKSNGQHQPYVKLLNFQNIHRDEQGRCAHYSKELEKLTEHWNSRKEVLQRLMDEVKHANHLFNISDSSFHQYSHAMYTIHKDIFLDDQGQRVLSCARQQILLKKRGTDDNNTDGGDCSGDEEHTCNTRRSLSTRMTGGRSAAYLNPLYTSFSVLTETMMKSVLERDHCKHAAAIEFLNFSEDLMAQAEAIEALGNGLLLEMMSSEMDIQNSFLVLEQLATKIKSGTASFSFLFDVRLGQPNKEFPKEMVFGGVNANTGDWWLWETLYRAAVKHQETSWTASRERMKGVEESITFFQLTHQAKLEKAVLAVMPEQRKLFLVGAKAFEAALKRTTGTSDVAKATRLDHESIAQEFDEGVRKQSTSLLQEKTHHKSRILNRSRSKYNSAIEQAGNPSGDLDKKQLEPFESPTESKLVLQAKVVERWENKSWMTTLAIYTVDRFLHLFDCEDIDTKTLPKTAFASMFPTTVSRRTSCHYQGKGRKRAKKATEHTVPTPSISFNLQTCTVKTYAYSHRSFELIQEADPTAKNQDDLPHTTLRFKDLSEASHWYKLLQDIRMHEIPTADTSGDQDLAVKEEPRVSEAEATIYDEAEAALAGSPNESFSDHNGDEADDFFEDASEYLQSDGDNDSRGGDSFLEANEDVGDDLVAGTDHAPPEGKSPKFVDALAEGMDNIDLSD